MSFSPKFLFHPFFHPPCLGGGVFFPPPPLGPTWNFPLSGLIFSPSGSSVTTNMNVGASKATGVFFRASRSLFSPTQTAHILSSRFSAVFFPSIALFPYKLVPFSSSDSRSYHPLSVPVSRSRIGTTPLCGSPYQPLLKFRSLLPRPSPKS